MLDLELELEQSSSYDAQTRARLCGQASCCAGVCHRVQCPTSFKFIQGFKPMTAASPLSTCRKHGSVLLRQQKGPPHCGSKKACCTMALE